MRAGKALTVAWRMALAAVLCALLPPAAGAAAGCLAARYSVTALPFPPAALNAAGDVAGTDQRHRAALRTRRGAVVELGLPAGFDVSEALSLNDSGQVLAVASDRAAARHQAYVAAGRRITLLAGDQTVARKINRAGVIAGEALLQGRHRPDPVTWTHGDLKSLGGCCGGSVRDLNSSGDAIGDAYDNQGRYRAFLWTRDGGLQLIGPEDQYSSAIALNDAGVIVVQGLHKNYRFAAGDLQALTLSPRYPSHPRAINRCGLIVGSFGPFSDADRAFAWDPAAGFVDLNDRLEPDSGWKLQSALGVNDAGTIIGHGDSRDKDDVGFLMVPQPVD